MLSRASVVVRPVARAVAYAARPAPVAALRAFSSSAKVASGHGHGPAPPIIVGPGAKDGEVPTAYDQATGLERFQLLGDIAGINVFDQDPLDSSRIGTKANPIVVPATATSRIIGCTGSPADSHDVLWYELTEAKQRRCYECGSVYQLAVEH
ncbi:cytochrome c oxidase subunit VB-domain-containing protein [Mucidula mucida]|nr:cytochrome c oxidase subunit VB-domain-containing protein [Mucidula mucida]